MAGGTVFLSALVLAVAGTIPPNLNPWKNASHPLPKYVLERNSPMGPQNAKEMYRELADFPLAPEKLKWPQENPWVKTRGAREVRVKDFGWNAENATEAFEKAFATPAKVVVVDKMSGPWRVETINVPDGRTLVLEKGVQILGTKDSQLTGSKASVIEVRSRDVFILGKGDNYVGRYTEKEETGRNVNRQYGGCGLGVNCAENVAVKNITFANNGCDGACICGDRRPSKNIWFEDCVFDRNTRQGVSIISADGVYFRNCTFSRTCGLAPKCGIDIEPWLPQCNATANIYIFNCTFDENQGGHLQFSTSSLWPVTVYVKDCVFKSHATSAIGITQRVLYPENQTDAPSDLIFENCQIEARRGVTPIRFDDGSFFHVTFRGGTVNEHDGYKASVPPIRFRLNREFRMEKDNSPVPRPVPEGSIVFDNLKIKGYDKMDELMTVEDTAKLCSVNSLHGTVIHNGKKRDVAKFRYPGADALAAEKDAKGGKAKDKRKGRKTR